MKLIILTPTTKSFGTCNIGGDKMQNFILTQGQLKEIAENLFLTDHAKERMQQRLNTTDVDIIKNYITHPQFAWVNYDKAINIAINTGECLIIEKADNGYVLVTVKAPSQNDIPPSTKFAMAFFGKHFKGNIKKTSVRKAHKKNNRRI